MLYPSAPLLIIRWTLAQFPDRGMGTTTPADLQEVLADEGAFIRIQRSGGARRYTLDQASMDLDVFTADPQMGYEIADLVCNEVCNAWEFDMPGAHIDAGEHGRATVARVDITSAPSRRPVTDSSLTRVGATAQIVLKSL